MNQAQRGFTLIELVMVIVILGVLAAVALPKFVDLKGDAIKAATDGVAGAVSSAATINYAKYQISTTGAVRLNTATPCADLTATTNTLTGLTASLVSLKVSISAEGTCVGQAAGTSVSCTLASTDDTSKTATATIFCTN
jgi:MSHA pilin protein MshA